MNLPPFVYSKAFWEAFTTATAGVLGLLAFLGYIDPSWAVPASVLLTWVFALLRLFGIQPELKLKLLERKLERAEELVQEAAIVRNDLIGLKIAEKQSKRK